MPEIYIQPPLADARIKSNEPDNNFGGHSALYVGKHPTWSVFRSLVHFDMSRLPLNIEMVTAQLKMYLWWDPYGTTVELGVFTILQPWQEGTVTWNNAPNFDPVPSATVNVSTGINRFINWNLDNLVKSWFYGSVANLGLLIKAGDETIDNLRGLRAREYNSSYQWPRLYLTYRHLGRLSNRAFLDMAWAALLTGGVYAYTESRDVSECTAATFIAANMGSAPAVIKLQLSADGTAWFDDTLESTVGMGETKTLVPAIYARYIRLGYRSQSAAVPTTLDVRLQARV
ncbi:MAG: DNRLRE domain-containing protein [Firmicutes bacterium]|nr:DNRLRE domain-containing protein [Bacillota bacterium]